MITEKEIYIYPIPACARLKLNTGTFHFIELITTCSPNHYCTLNCLLCTTSNGSRRCRTDWIRIDVAGRSVFQRRRVLGVYRPEEACSSICAGVQEYCPRGKAFSRPGISAGGGSQEYCLPTGGGIQEYCAPEEGFGSVSAGGDIEEYIRRSSGLLSTAGGIWEFCPPQEAFWSIVRRRR